MSDKTSIEWTDDNRTSFVFKRGAMVSGKKAERWAISSPEDPLRWRKPRHVELRSDLFHEDVPDEWIDRVFAVMALCPQHTFQILTKRPERMRAYCQSRLARAMRIAGCAGRDYWTVLSRISAGPLPNVWLGTSVENQPTADERIPHFLATPAAVRFVSAEPLLNGVDLMPYLYIVTHHDNAVLDAHERIGSRATLDYNDPATTDPRDIAQPRIDWVIVGGESGPGARPMHPDWARKIRDDCAAAGVAFHFKQNGSWSMVYDQDRDDPDWRLCPKANGPHERYVNIAGGHGFHGERVLFMRRVGKTRAGRLLDGVEHNGMPEVTG